MKTEGQDAGRRAEGIAEALYQRLFEPMAPRFVDKVKVRIIQDALLDRDMEWWQALVLVDNVAPTPEAARDWLLRLAAHEQDAAVAEAVKERDAEIARLREEIEDSNAAYRSVVEEACEGGITYDTDDRMHCTCVPHLRQALREARREERERCAKVADHFFEMCVGTEDYHHGYWAACIEIAATIVGRPASAPEGAT